MSRKSLKVVINTRPEINEKKITSINVKTFFVLTVNSKRRANPGGTIITRNQRIKKASSNKLVP